MAKSPKLYWKLGKVPSFKPDFLKLTPYGQWVGKTIESMLYIKNPEKIWFWFMGGLSAFSAFLSRS